MKHYILVDRSGSMTTRWAEVMQGVKVYLEQVADGDTITFALFDSPLSAMHLDVLSENTKASEVALPTENMARGMTPLYDAMGSAYDAFAGEERGVLLVVTDGNENSSREHTNKTVAALREEAEARGIETIFIGADFKDFSDAEAVGVRVGTTMTIADGRYGEAFRSLGVRTSQYSATGVQAQLDVTDKERAEWASKEK
jgi:uncharacterized protein with von Willebrand factor type A (vWA) domain